MSEVSIIRQHQEWLQLLEVSGPFLAMPIIAKIFPQGLERIDSATKRDLRLAYREWQESHSNDDDSRTYHTPWIKYVLKNLLQYPGELLLEGDHIPSILAVELPEHGERLKPDMVLMQAGEPADGAGPRILISTFSGKQKLDRAVSDKSSRWTASPATRMMELLKRTGVRLGIVTNGENWLLVYAPEVETTSFVNWYASVWMEEELTIRSFRALLSSFRLFGVPHDQTLESLFIASTEFQHEVTTQLGSQVRKAIEQLIQALDQIDKDSGRTLLQDVSEAKLYEAGVSVMMRLVFLLTAEERELFPINNLVYRDNYAVSTLREQLEELSSRHGEEVLERRYDAWNRLLATFRAIFAGVRHEDFNLPAYGGTLFDPDRYPFLEGRAPLTVWHVTNVIPLSVNDRTVLHLLDSLQLLRGTGPKSDARRLSFRSLDVEQIGHIYESLLEHTAVRADNLVLGLEGAQGKEPEVPISKLEYHRERGEPSLIEWLQDETGKSTSALSKLLKKQDRHPDYKIRAVCDNDETLYLSVKPFVGLVREDSQNMPVIFSPGSLYVTEGSERRSTGTHYTPRSLTEPIVQHVIEPLLYKGLSNGISPSLDTLRSPKEILELKVCDMTCGSGAFLVQCCRYISERLVDAWSKYRLEIADDIDINIYGQAISDNSDIKDIVPRNPDDALIVARRLIADRCLYGVDCNAMAVEMAKLSLWLITLQQHRPFAFLDHAIKCGDSLVGVSTAEQFNHLQFSTIATSKPRLVSGMMADLLSIAAQNRQKIGGLLDADICDSQTKQRLHLATEHSLNSAKSVADIVAYLMMSKSNNPESAEGHLDFLSLSISSLLATEAKESSDQLATLKDEWRNQVLASCPLKTDRTPFHWYLEFPEVFNRVNPGFDAFIGNPPFAGGRKLLGTLGSNYRDWLGNVLYPNSTTNADLVAFFFRRAFDLLRSTGNFGLISTNSIAESHTSTIGLGKILALGGQIYRATSNMPWPGKAGVIVSVVHVQKSASPGNSAYLNGSSVDVIDQRLMPLSNKFSKPKKLKVNRRYSEGSHLGGDGFIITAAERASIIAKDSKNAEVIYPYMNGEALNSIPDQKPSSFVINFGERDYDAAAHYREAFKLVTDRVKPYRDELSGQIHETRYWLFWDKRQKFYEHILSLRRVLVTSRVTKFLSFSFAAPEWIFSDAIKIFAIEDEASFAVLQSAIHNSWARAYSSYLKNDLRYTTSAAFETFPWPPNIEPLGAIGAQYETIRKSIMVTRQQGLTTIYNLMHSRTVQDSDIGKLRDLQVELDSTLLSVYGWDDIQPDFDFHFTSQGLRFGMSESAKSLILKRLFELNKEQSEKEEHEKQASGPRRKARNKTFVTSHDIQ